MYLMEKRTPPLFMSSLIKQIVSLSTLMNDYASK